MSQEKFHPQRRQSGQAAVESALTLPLVVFLVLGTLQLFMMLQGRIMAEYAAFQAVRAGSRHHGDCKAMSQAALGGLLPSIIPFLGGSGGSPASKLAEAWAARAGDGGKSPKYAPGQGDGKHDGPIFWMIREHPRGQELEDGDDTHFDIPNGNGAKAVRMEIRLIYWYRLRIPFADWVIGRMIQARYGLKDYDAVNPLIPTDANAGWTESTEQVVNLDPKVRDELNSRINSGQYVFPIQATYGMRMMTPVHRVHFEQQNCDPAPEGM